ncbi:BlaI/MecI/CopY family transcriptional regulator [Anaerovirgula multivorans]|uniref:BlaI/MecI/CopY family transcriptional regulator n=1 Tax=Anaerovirgula multivorans TaxID=312168 RepID=UPI001FA8518D|nr:BlaI/MecI/CopY family transcriptional regulator [Anaerovirgula multivorans]
MKVVWANDLLITTSIVMEQSEQKKEWKAQTIITLLLRLAEGEFLRTIYSKIVKGLV